MHIFYDPQATEKKWQKRWENARTFKSNKDSSLKKFYLLEMFPYPSGRIHMGHVRVYTIGDVIARFKRMCGFNVLHPMGWDAFGMPAENAAIANNTHPAKWTYQNIDQMRIQLKRLGFSYDWDREITTCKPEYYKWEQWLFVKMVKNGMAYRKKALVNWCESCKTVLANEQVENNVCWRCGQNVIQKELRQWFLRITDYANDLLVHCDKLPGWPDKVTTMQKNWIGKSLGLKIDFQIENFNDKISIFTTRPDTIFGATFISLASKHSLVLQLAEKSSRYRENILEFVKRMSLQDRSSRTIDSYEKEGVFTGMYCINPANEEKIPIYIVNFVLMEYGTGAIMSVPAHDQRDLDFARKYNLEIRIIINPKNNLSDLSLETKALTQKGIMINSGPFDGLDNNEAVEHITKYLEEKNVGHRTVRFRLRDWGISRQRYWGTPIPIVYCDKCGAVPVKEDSLPIILPEEKNLLDGGLSPLPKMKEFVNTVCPDCGQDGARRETDTMDTFVESSWYFERFCSPSYSENIFDKKAVSYWMPVDQYVGGIEHAILHLLYSRYVTRILKKLELVDYKEPFSNIITQGMVCKETLKCPQDGFIFPEEVTKNKNGILCCIKCGKSINIGRIEKMSKSKKNIIDPSVFVNKYGADALRLFCLFTAPPEKDLEWNEQGVEGSLRFLNRVWLIVHKWLEINENFSMIDRKEIKLEILVSSTFRKLLIKTHETIKKVTNDIEKRFHFNTAISSIMELVNTINTIKYLKLSNVEKSVLYFSIETLLLLLNPIVPHFCEELWTRLTKTELLIEQPWPKYNENIILKNKIILVIQVNGKLRSRVEVRKNMTEDEIKDSALSDKNIEKHVRNKTVKKIIFVKNKLINIVV